MNYEHKHFIRNLIFCMVSDKRERKGTSNEKIESKEEVDKLMNPSQKCEP